MPCYSPLQGWRKIGGGFTQNKNISTTIEMTVPCGRCIGCRLDYSRDWAVRCQHEISLNPHNNCFITLTYAPEHLPANAELKKEDFKNFMKRLRRKFPDQKFSYFHCGEYGEERGRPHYHAILFNFRFPDEKPFKPRNGFMTYKSEILRERWGKGIVEIGEANWHSAAYVARYITKKVYGDDADDAYKFEILDDSTGEIHTGQKQKEYVTMSLKIPSESSDEKGGIGYNWYQKYKKDLFYSGRRPSCIMRKPNGKSFECRVPRYYWKQLEQDDPERYEKLKHENLEFAKEQHNKLYLEAIESYGKEEKIEVTYTEHNGFVIPDRNYTLDPVTKRLKAKEFVKQKSANQLVRKYDKEGLN